MQDNNDIFAWAATDMHVMDKSGMNPNFDNSYVKCGSRKEDNEAEEEERRSKKAGSHKAGSRKAIQASFIEEIQFPQWLGNLVMVKKDN